ncbi:MAG: histidinol-phosphate transaminase [Clostridia bacterium]|nr:histidinol-phosphate transaminase [Clostridia bacterium]
MSRFLSDRLLRLTPYTPGEQPQDFNYVKLNTNESPFEPSPEVIKALNTDEVSLLRLYSDPECKKTVKAVADYYGVDSSNVVLGNGSDEILSFIFEAFCDNDTPVAFPDISYGFYEVFASLYGIKAHVIPLRDDYSLCADDYCALNETIVIANPNAPTGMSISLADIEKIVSTNPDNVVVIDEAYVDFGGETAVELTKKYDNLVVVQTFSKSRQLAGARLGFAIANEAIITDLNTVRFSTNPYNINRLTLLAGEAAIKDTAYFEKTRALIIENRAYTVSELEKRSFTVLDSKTNFVFASHKSISGEELYKGLKANGVLVRFFNKPRLDKYLRITIGTREQMDALLAALDKIIYF